MWGGGRERSGLIIEVRSLMKTNWGQLDEKVVNISDTHHIFLACVSYHDLILGMRSVDSFLFVHFFGLFVFCLLVCLFKV